MPVPAVLPQPIAENLWLLRYPLRILGIDARRNVAVIRLAGGELIVHSTAPFSREDAARIRSLGPVGWILDAMLDHDTFSRLGRDAFPEARFLGPAGFESRVRFPVGPLVPPPTEWGDEVACMEIGGIPGFGEHAMLHRPSRTLIVADLLFSFPGPEDFLTRMAMKLALKGKADAGVSRRLLLAIRDEAALRESLHAVLEWDFDRVIVGHGDPIPADGRHRMRRAFQNAGLI